MLPKDVYLYLIDFVTDEDVASMLATNKQYYKDEYFYNVLKKRYPCLVQHNYDLMKYPKVQLMSWKDFWIRSTRHMSLLMKEFGIPYIPHSYFEPSRFYDLCVRDLNTALNIGFKYAVEIGHKELTDLFLTKGVTNTGTVFYEAAEYGNTDMIKYLLENYPVFNNTSMINSAMLDAAHHDHVDTVKYLLNYDPDQDEAVEAAIYGNATNVVRYLLDISMNSYHNWDPNYLLTLANEEGDPEMIQLIRGFGSRSF